MLKRLGTAINLHRKERKEICNVPRKELLGFNVRAASAAIRGAGTPACAQLKICALL